ncbi:MAG TPA: flagellar hook protein FlgE [Rhodoferax sp.]|jgi:flagellar hook protein FlgE|nr:flagellar hook protein FlgE [Rhodoferax sp.]
MSFQTGLSGLNASSKSLDVIGNNIANANTVGMKSSRAEFADLVASSLGAGGGGAGAGIGVAVATIAQQFSQGNINITGNSLDVAINGNGFFQVTRPDGSTAFTRDGQLKLDKDGNIITNTGAAVMGYPTDLITGAPTGVTPQPLSVPTSAPIPANATTEITAEFNLDARAVIAASATPPTPISTYGTSLTTYDSQGVALPVSLYFSKVTPTTAGTDQWAVYTDPAGGPANYAGALVFDATGALTAASTVNTLTLSPSAYAASLTPPRTSIVPDFTVTVDVSKVTQFGVAFNVSNLNQDGYTAGELTGISIEPSGTITTRYSNGETQYRGQLALADFRNVQGLTPIGSGEYLETFKSGQPVLGNPGIGKFGELRAGAVEESNVDLTAELVNMMTAQRNYQANAQTIKTQDQIMSTLVNLR